MPKYFSSEEALKRLKRFFSLEYDLIRHTIGFVPRIPEYTIKCQFTRHVYEDWKRCRALRERIQDFGIPKPDKQIDEQWTNLVRLMISAVDSNHFIAAFYRVVKREQAAAYREYAECTLRLNDGPSVDAIEDHLPVLERQIAWGKQFMEAGKVSPAEEMEVEKFEEQVREHLRALGGLYEGLPTSEAENLAAYPEYVLPAEMELEPAFTWRSVERIFDVILDKEIEKEEHPAHHSYTHFTELPIIDLCANIVYDGRHLGFEYVSDFIRQTWDEARHS
jgi:hypothetical protein